MNLLALDYETYYSQDYSLSALTTEAYIRDKRFKAHGAALSLNGSPPRWVTGALLPRVLAAVNWPNTALLCHHAHFDGAILAWHYGHTPALYLDTMSMARVGLPDRPPSPSVALAKLAEQYGLEAKGTALALTKGLRNLPQHIEAQLAAYCEHDVALTLQLWDILRQGFPPQEIRLIDLTVRMFARPLLEVDEPMLWDHLEGIQARKAALLTQSDMTPERLQSAALFCEALNNLNVAVETKPGKRRPIPAIAKTDTFMLSLQEHDDERVQALAAARLGFKSTIDETRTQRFLDIASRGALPVYLKYYGAHTGRWSGADKSNAQNLRRGSPLRECLQAPPGHVVVVADSAQIEARMLAWLAIHEGLLDAFRRGDDIYTAMGEQVGADRKVGKVLILGLGYGMGAAKLQDTLARGPLGMPPLHVDAATAQRWVDAYRHVHAPIPALWRRMEHMIQSLYSGVAMALGPLQTHNGALVFPDGTALHYKNLRRGSDGWAFDAGREEGKLYGGLMTENCISIGTRVLTDQGWVPIEQITVDMQVYDGVEWVSHKGLHSAGKRWCIAIDGVYMTPDHEVLNDDEAWQAAGEGPRPYRPSLWLAYGRSPAPQQRQNVVLDLSLPVRGEDHPAGDRGNAARTGWGHPVMRVQALGITLEGPYHARYVCPPRLSRLAQHVEQVLSPIAHVLSALRRAGRHGLRRLAAIRRVFEGYGGGLAEGGATRAARPEQALSERQLHMGLGLEGYTGERGHGYGRTVQTDRHTAEHALLPPQKRTVFDIKDAGPRARFVVQGLDGPLIVHNCVQKLARSVVADQMVEIARRYPVVLMTHDEVVAIAPEHEAEDALSYMLGCMRVAPKWCSDLPLNAEGGYAVNYSK